MRVTAPGSLLSKESLGNLGEPTLGLTVPGCPSSIYGFHDQTPRNSWNIQPRNYIEDTPLSHGGVSGLEAVLGPLK